MPIYEYHCEACDETFEALAPVSAGDASRDCPECGSAAPRIISVCAIGASADLSQEQTAPTPHRHAHSHRSPIPGYARPCWMDDRSAERFAAYKMGRGTEYDDKAAAREELRKRRGLPPETPDPNSPVARMIARKKAQEAMKVQEAKPASGGAASADPAPTSRPEPRPSN